MNDKKKEVLKFLTILVLFFFTSVLSAATVSIPDTEGGTGATVQVPVEIDDASAIAGFQFTVTFSHEVLQPTGASAGTLTGEWMFFCNTDIPGQVTVAGLDPNLEELGEEAGSLLTLSFLVTGELEETTSFAFADTFFYNALAEDISIAFQAGIFTVDVQVGDVNGDESINISDVILCLRIAIGLPVTIGEEIYSGSDPGGYPAWLESRSDMNGDGSVNIQDVILILRKSIGLDP